MMANEIQHKGNSFPVTAAWWDQCCAAYPEFVGSSKEEISAEIKRLLRNSDENPLSHEDRKRLDVATHHFNVRNAIDFLAGRPLSDFGFTGADQVHGNSISFNGEDQCGCVLHFIFDHQKRFDPEGPQHHPHYPKHVCEKHKQHKFDLNLLHSTVIAHNRKPG